MQLQIKEDQLSLDRVVLITPAHFLQYPLVNIFCSNRLLHMKQTLQALEIVDLA